VYITGSTGILPGELLAAWSLTT